MYIVSLLAIQYFDAIKQKNKNETNVLYTVYYGDDDFTLKFPIIFIHCI